MTNEALNYFVVLLTKSICPDADIQDILSSD